MTFGEGQAANQGVMQQGTEWGLTTYPAQATLGDRLKHITCFI